MKKTSFASLIALILFAVVCLAQPAFATVTQTTGGATSVSHTELTNPLTGNATVTSLPELVNRVATMAIGLSGVMALLAFVYGGVLYLMAGVNLEFMKKGKEIMKWAVVGLVIIFSSYAVINFVLTSILKLK